MVDNTRAIIKAKTLRRKGQVLIDLANVATATPEIMTTDAYNRRLRGFSAEMNQAITDADRHEAHRQVNVTMDPKCPICGTEGA